MDFEKLKELRNVGFNREVGIVTAAISEGYARVEVEIGPQHVNPIGSVHGGVLFTIADTTAGGGSYQPRALYDDYEQQYEFPPSGDRLQKADRRIQGDQSREAGLRL